MYSSLKILVSCTTQLKEGASGKERTGVTDQERANNSGQKEIRLFNGFSHQNILLPILLWQPNGKRMTHDWHASTRISLKERERERESERERERERELQG